LHISLHFFPLGQLLQKITTVWPVTGVTPLASAISQGRS